VDKCLLVAEFDDDRHAPYERIEQYDKQVHELVCSQLLGLLGELEEEQTDNVAECYDHCAELNGAHLS